MMEYLLALIKLVVMSLGVGLLGILLALVYRGLDRRVAARLQARIGPPLLQPFYDVRKLMLKETVLPKNAVAWLYSLAPVIALTSTIMLLLYIPWGPFPAVLGNYGDIVLVAYLLMLPSLAMVIGGFASGSPYASVGAQREMVLMMSYELPLSAMAVAFAWKLGTFTLSGIAANPIWLAVGPMGFVGVALLAVVALFIIPAELSKTPFDAPEAETELAGGLFVEYSGMNYALFYIADAVKAFAVGALAVTLFFPFQLGLPLWIEALWFLTKVFIVLTASVTVMRVAAARMQIDKAASYYWGPMATLGICGVILLVLDTMVVA